MRPTTEELLAGYSLLREIHDNYERASQELEANLAVPLCIENCGLCCHVPTVWGIEAYYVISTIAGEAGGLPSLLGLTEEWVLGDVAGAKTIAGENQDRTLATTAIASEADAISQSRCPYLHSMQKCIIYLNRPIPCRAIGLTVAVCECKRMLGIGENMTRRAIYAGAGGATLKQKVSQLFSLPGFLGEVGFLPMLLYRIAREDKLKEYIYNGRVLAAKLISCRGATPAPLWQQGVSPISIGGSYGK